MSEVTDNPYEKLDREKDAFVEEYGEEIKDKFNVDPEEIYKKYVTYVKPHLLVITDFIANKNKSGNKIFEKEIGYIFGLRYKEFKAMKHCFVELEEALGAERSLMKFKSAIALSEANRLKPASAKIIDIMLRKYDDEYLKKEEKPNNEHKVTIDFANGLNPLKDDDDK